MTFFPTYINRTLKGSDFRVVVQFELHTTFCLMPRRHRQIKLSGAARKVTGSNRKEEQDLMGLLVIEEIARICPHSIENTIIPSWLQGVARVLQELSSLTSLRTALEYYCKLKLKCNLK